MIVEPCPPFSLEMSLKMRGSRYHETLRDRGGGIAGAIIDDDDLECAGKALIVQRAKPALEIRLDVVGRNDDGKHLSHVVYLCLFSFAYSEPKRERTTCTSLPKASMSAGRPVLMRARHASSATPPREWAPCTSVVKSGSFASAQHQATRSAWGHLGALVAVALERRDDVATVERAQAGAGFRTIELPANLLVVERLDAHAMLGIVVLVEAVREVLSGGASCSGRAAAG